MAEPNWNQINPLMRLMMMAQPQRSFSPDHFARPAAPQYTLPKANFNVTTDRYDPTSSNEYRGNVDLGNGFGASGRYQPYPNEPGRPADWSALLNYRREF